MRGSDSLRDRAARLLALALKARENGKVLLSEEITKLAIEASDKADEMDRDEVQHQQPAHQHPSAHRQPAQQQQQQQPSSDKEADKPPETESA
jgi:hypothetical protein